MPWDAQGWSVPHGSTVVTPGGSQLLCAPACPDSQPSHRDPGSPALLTKPEESRIPIQQCCWNPCPRTHCDVLEISAKEDLPLTCCVAWKFLTKCFWWQFNEYQKVRKHFLCWELTVIIMLWSWNSVCCVFWESLYWGLANRVNRAGWEPTAQQLRLDWWMEKHRAAAVHLPLTPWPSLEHWAGS